MSHHGMSYRNDLDALAARHAALEAEVAEVSRQRDELRLVLEDAKSRAKLPILDNIRIASPCSEKWADMIGDDRVRACAKCNQDVYNLSPLTRDEAEALIRERAGRMCVRYYQRRDGTILLADCTVGRSGKRHRRALAAGIAASIAAGTAGYIAHARPHDDVDVDVMMGDIREVAGGPMFAPPPTEDEAPPPADEPADVAVDIPMKL